MIDITVYKGAIFNQEITQKIISQFPCSNKYISGDITILYNNRTDFTNDNLFFENSKYCIAVGGIILNRQDLVNKNASRSFIDFLIRGFESDKNNFIRNILGDYFILIYRKDVDKLYIYNDPKSSIPIYYTEGEITIISTRIYFISAISKIIDRKLNLNNLGAYFLITYGFMLDDTTLIKEVKKLKPGACISVENNGIETKRYFTFQNTPFHDKSTNELEKEFYARFQQAITLEYQKDLEYSRDHLATLSGGLDSRFCVFTANSLGYYTTNVTISQTNYLDEKIAKRMSTDLNNDFIFLSIDSSRHLQELGEIVKNNDGLILYSGSAHIYASLKKIGFGEFGLLHTGMIGDAVTGSMLKKPVHIKPRPQTGAYSGKLLSKIQNEVLNICSDYENNEMFLLYNRLFNGVLNGHLVIRNFVLATSPFLNTNLLDYALKISPKDKFGQNIYRNCIKKFQPRAYKYKWETTSLKPRFSPRIKYLTKGVIYSYSKMLGKKDLYISMNPFDYWYKYKQDLREFMDNTFMENVDLLNQYQDLKNDCTFLFKNGTVHEKAQVLTLLEAIKLHNL